MWPIEEKVWFVHNDDESLWTDKGWSDRFENAVLYKSEEDARKTVEALRTIYPGRMIGYNPMYEAYLIVIQNKKDRLREDMEYTANEAQTFTSFYARGKLFFDLGRAEREADHVWFDLLGEDQDIDVSVIHAGGDGDLRYSPFTREEQNTWLKKQHQEFLQTLDQAQ